MLLKNALRTLLWAVLLVLSPLTLSQTVTVTYVHTDHLGSPVMGRTQAGATSFEARYEPFGSRQSVSGSAGDIGYTGHYADQSLGLINAGARWYDQEVGRMLSPDAVRFTDQVPLSFNRYAYGLNNPYRHIDPDGNWVVPVLAVAGIGALLTFSEYANAPAVGDEPMTRSNLERVGVLAIAPVARGSTVIAAASARGVTKGTATAAESAANGLRLNKSLASQAQMGEAGTAMAGTGARVPFRDAQRVAREHGGNSADWVKKTSSSHTARDGTTFETHWVENIRTGQRVEFKTKLPGGD